MIQPSPHNFDLLVNTWQQCYEITQKSKKAKQARLQELETWDTSNGHETERQAKIQALKNLLTK